MTRGWLMLRCTQDHCSSLNQEWSLNGIFLSFSSVISVCFVVKNSMSHWLEQRKHEYPFFTLEKHVFGERQRNPHTAKKLVTGLCRLSPIPPRNYFFCHVATQRLTHFVVSWSSGQAHLLFLVYSLYHTNTHGSHKKLFRVIKTYWNYYCLALNFLGKKGILSIWEEKLWGFPGIWGFEMFCGKTMQRGGGGFCGVKQNKDHNNEGMKLAWQY